MNLFIIFLTGLTTGGLSCLAMQGGLLASVIANGSVVQGTNSRVSKIERYWLPVGMFLLTKLIAHTVLGFLLGMLGSVITLSLEVRLFFQFFTAFFMFSTAMNLLDVHPIFRYVAFQPPKFIRRLVKDTTKSKAVFAPAILGLLTIFIPCGVTQAMEVLAINSGSPITGALTMFVFVLGTSPLFAILGVATARLSQGLYKKFTKIASTALILMAIYSINGVLVVIDSPLTVQRLVQPVTHFFSDERFDYANTIEVVGGEQQVTINILNSGYQPNYIKVKKDVPVRLTLISDQVYSCALAFVFKEFNINTFLKASDRQSFTFTPTEVGKFTFTCSMGMYTGTMEVVDR